MDGLASGEGLPALAHLTALAISPAQGARIRLHSLPRLQRLVCDLGSSGSSGRELVSEQASVHVPAAGHGLPSLAQLELRCFVWRHWEADGSEDGGSQDGGSSSSSSEDGSQSGSSSSDNSSEGEAASDSSSSEWDDEEPEEDAASIGNSASGSEDGSSVAGTDAADEMAVDGWEEEEEAAGEAAAGGEADDDDGVEEEEEVQGAGLLEASWGFMQQGRGGGRAASAQGVPAIVSLEQR